MDERLNRCCGSCSYVNWPRIGLVIGYFFAVVFCMSLMQLWIESQEIPGETTGQCKLFDTGQFLIGNSTLTFMSTSFFSSVADVWVVASVVGFFFWLGLDF